MYGAPAEGQALWELRVGPGEQTQDSPSQDASGSYQWERQSGREGRRGREAGRLGWRLFQLPRAPGLAAFLQDTPRLPPLLLIPPAWQGHQR